MKNYALRLSGLSCSRCVNKLKAALEKTFVDLNIQTINTTQIQFSSSASLEDIYPTITGLGYNAGYHYQFDLSGLNCNKCVAKLQQHLLSHPGLTIQHIDTHSLDVLAIHSSDTLQTWIEEVGYQSTLKTTVNEDTSVLTSIDSVPTKATPQTSTERLSKKPSHTEDEGITPQTTTIQLLIQGMTCASCVSSVERSLMQVQGIARARVNLAEQSAVIALESSIEKNADSHAITQRIQTALIDAVTAAGYQAEIVNDLSASQAAQQQRLLDHQQRQKKNTIVALSLGAPLMLWGVLGGNMMIRNPLDQAIWGAIGLLCLWLLATAGRDFFVNAINALKHKRATMDTLVALGTGAAWLYSTLVVIKPDWFPLPSRHVYFEASAMIIGLISLGHFIEAKAKARTNQSLQALMTLQPKHAIALIDGKEISLPISDIKVGMTLRIKPGEKIPVDAQVSQGQSYVDESMLTGEPIAMSKQPGDWVAAGTLNRDGSLVIIASGVGKNTKLSRIITMVRDAQSSKPAIAKLADSISAVFVPVVVVIAIVSALIWFLVGPEPQISYMLVVSTTVLIIACPCALGLATPLSITVGIGKAAQAGILIKDADALQKLSHVTTVVFDKTGTLTIGQPSVQQIFLFDIDEPELAELVVPLEKRSEHPLAKSVVQYWENSRQNDTGGEVEQFTNLQGKGVSGVVQGRTVLIASLNHIQQLGLNTTELDQTLQQCQRLAATPVVVVIDGHIRAIIAIADDVKDEAAHAIAALKANGVHTVMLTGDNRHVANTVSKAIGVDETISEVLPEEKADHIKRLQRQYGHVAMVGDGINDAPALALADVGVAMGTGSDVAIESAAMTLLNSNPNSINYAIELSRATVKNIKQNLFSAFIYNTLGIPIAAGVLYPIFGFLLSPVFAGAAMALSSITVVTNANRLRNFTSKH
ncbi:cation transporter [Vibrio methylphosphonaticus]|uniref:cation transporter n=1 Tax=Vibrio methylphosphonaticus TaxID=2946866 RepID=UPI00202A3F28|nr:cation transporter [Vibrio methylphosphonaticus]MCL9773233.1 cadmium-translocating P-type ATPase [Vibrio methylphosphonaticus]